MIERTYPFDDCVVRVHVQGMDRSGQLWGVVDIQTPGDQGHLIAPQRVSLFDARAWRAVAHETARNNSGNVELWEQRGGEIRVALIEDSEVAGLTTQPGSNFTSDHRTYKSEVRLTRVNAAELRCQTLTNPGPRLRSLPFLGRDSVVIQGLSHLLAGYPKTGKTELLTRLAGEWSQAGLRVVYFTEEPRSVWEARLAGLPGEFGSVEIVFSLGAKLPDFLDAIESGDEAIVVLDTLRLLGIRDENDNAAINQTLTPLIATCRVGDKTLVMAHHTRKGGGSNAEAAAGGHAFVGVVDIALELSREANIPRRRLIRGWGRVVEVPELVYHVDEDGLMTVLGDPSELAFREVKDRIVEVLTDGWQTSREVGDALGDPRPSPDQVGKALMALAKEGVAERDPPIAKGRKQGATYRWKLGTDRRQG